jgi:hypothetical protein
MHGPRRDPRTYRRNPDPTWRGIAVGYALVAAVPLLLWVASRPVAGTAALAAAGGLFVATRRLLRLRRCLNECGGFVFDLAGDVRVRVTREAGDPAC